MKVWAIRAVDYVSFCQVNDKIMWFDCFNKAVDFIEDFDENSDLDKYLICYCNFDWDPGGYLDYSYRNTLYALKVQKEQDERI
tara:strand:+ start:1243 stop:1491 length:249 start_codon:yes stop_codon:yes gene_type:complete